MNVIEGEIATLSWEESTLVGKNANKLPKVLFANVRKREDVFAFDADDLIAELQEVSCLHEVCSCLYI